MAPLAMFLIDVAEEGDAVAAGDFGDVAQSLAAAADGGDVELFEGFFLAEQDVGSKRGAGQGGGGLDEIAAGGICMGFRGFESGCQSSMLRFRYAD